MSTIRVARGGETGAFSVTVSDDDDSATTHVVTVLGDDWERFGGGYPTREALVESSFAFLLEREPKESILRSFELNAIARYFPEFPSVIAERAPA